MTALLLLQVVEDGYEFFAKRQLVTIFSAPNYCGEFDNAGAMMSVDETLMCSFQVIQWQQTVAIQQVKIVIKDPALGLAKQKACSSCASMHVLPPHVCFISA